jgi:hypothetical protein
MGDLMKKSAKVTLTVVAAVGLASCARKHPDPCEAATFDEQACADAVRNGGYHYQGRWFPMVYHFPYPYYYDSYRSFTAAGGVGRTEPKGAYEHAGAKPATHAAPGVERGGFGSSGAAHGAGAGG